MKIIQDLLAYDGELRPVQPSPDHIWDGAAWQFSAERQIAALTQMKTEIGIRLDAAADAAGQPYAGNELRAWEYQRAAADAQAYKDAGYKGDAPASVQAWADAKSLSGKDAADGILAKAMAADQALAAIRAIRLKGKEAVRNATSLDAVQAAADSALAQLQAVEAGAPDASPADAAAKASLWRAPLKLFSR
ncbi:hypothetical protein [Chromobacterium sp. IIBBL 290-4]|uniref:hypothetical protein n=1 Tax=Chromobacterium sp. IIBBL 290-4 TaxID=2953890 RepID=UPI0020B7B745|nr:hypothetical protein [Chromobacterium sp. IIBBL 290-4]UTH76094.1 hypothetical protein NKT35_08330 [Chromobacterium sp. IIBBL 290-4]